MRYSRNPHILFYNFSDFCAYVTTHSSKKDHVITSNEGAAVGLASGYHLATGKPAMVYLQVMMLYQIYTSIYIFLEQSLLIVFILVSGLSVCLSIMLCNNNEGMSNKHLALSNFCNYYL